MSGPKKGDVQLKLNRALDISDKSAKSKWDNAYHLNSADSDATDTARNDASRKNGGADTEVRNAFDEGERLRREAERLKNEAENIHREASRRTNTLKGNISQLERDIASKNHYLQAEDSQAAGYVREAEGIEREHQRAADLLRQSSEHMRRAKTAFNQSVIIAEEKEEARRQFEMKRTATANALQSVKDDATSFGDAFLGEWGSNAKLAEAKQTLRSAENDFQAKRFDASQASSAKASEQFRNLYEQATNNKKRFDSREVIADAIEAALKDLQYDTPDLNYEPVDGIENTMLGNITIFAKSKGEIGDIRLEIDLNGKIDLNVEGIPEGKEAECHGAIANLQSKVAHIAKLKITDWGRAKNHQPEERGGIPKQKAQERIKQQQGAKR
jgi:hypothetical protein